MCRESVTRFIERRDGFPCDKVRGFACWPRVCSLPAFPSAAAPPRRQCRSELTARTRPPFLQEDIFLTDGASPAVHYCMKCFLRDKRDAILTPIPQYPLYSATISLYGGTLLPYYLDEATGWALDSSHLIDIVRSARADGKNVRALVVINPGNPTGQCLSRQNQEEVVRMCCEEQIILIADEVYQDNIYADNKNFQSFKKVAAELGLLGQFPLISLNSISKGAVGECGRRGGYMEITGVPEEVRDQFLKLASINLCPNVGGQMCTALVMDPPQPGDPSYEQYRQERQDILVRPEERERELDCFICLMGDTNFAPFPGVCDLFSVALDARLTLSLPCTHVQDSLKRRAAKLTAALNSLEVRLLLSSNQKQHSLCSAQWLAHSPLPLATRKRR